MTTPPIDSVNRTQKPSDDFRIPALNQLLRLSEAPSGFNGAPRWTIHDPVHDRYFKIGWAEFECLSRFKDYDHARALCAAVNNETTLDISMDDLTRLIAFLNRNGLLELSEQNVEFKRRKEAALWKKIVHSYLFFSIPLIKPDPFLRKTLPLVRPLLNRAFFICAMALFIFSIILTSQRVDEFFNTFIQVFSVQGIVFGLITFSVLKILHEMGHAYLAAKYGVNIPHMGVAFIILYPVLYTETSGSWRLSSRRSRILIALGGIMTELSIAGVFLLLWNFMPAGSLGQSLAFNVVAIATLSSLLVNLNPFMRFDGYYILSDVVKIDNLQEHAVAYARWYLRAVLFQLDDAPPADFSNRRARFLIIFGFCLLIYRFFLFVGIAILVYTLFFEPLGTILMAIELFWFIVLPIFSELRVWWQRRADIFAKKRVLILLSLVTSAALFFAAPTGTYVSLPATLHIKDYKTFYAHAPSSVKAIYIQDNQHVKRNDVLLELQSDDLDRQFKNAQNEKRILEDLQQQTAKSLDASQANDLSLNIKAAELRLNNLLEQKERLRIVAPTDGVVKDLEPHLKPGRFINMDQLLFHLLAPQSYEITAYINEEDLSRIHIGHSAYFYNHYDVFSKHAAEVTDISKTGAEAISWRELSSVYGGVIASEYDDDGVNLIPRAGVYRVRLKVHEETNLPLLFQTGTVRIHADRASLLLGWVRGLISIFIRESSVS